jgi:hypothetical protein
VDIYPLDVGSLYNGYMRNLDICASTARKYGADYSVYIQSVSFAASKRTPNETELRWQSYCCLSFGAKSIMYFTYITPYSSAEDFKAALIDHDLQKTDEWYYAQTVNREITAIADKFARYKNLGAFNYKADLSGRFLDFDNQYTAFTPIESVDCKNPLLFGCFEENEGEGYAFTVVNMTSLTSRDSGVSDVRVKLDASVADKTVTAYPHGIETILKPDSGGYVSLTLDVGEGVFVTIE